MPMRLLKSEINHHFDNTNGWLSGIRCSRDT
jgi:hypothetical protein